MFVAVGWKGVSSSGGDNLSGSEGLHVPLHEGQGHVSGGHSSQLA